MISSFIIAINGLNIPEQLDNDIEILSNIWLTNDVNKCQFINNPGFKEAVGSLEFENILSAPAIAYSERLRAHPSILTHHKPYLIELIQAVCNFLFSAWIVKDNSCYTEMGYIFQYNNQAGLISLQKTHSNLLYINCRNKYGESQDTNFSISEIGEIVEIEKRLGIYQAVQERLNQSPEELNEFKSNITFAVSDQKEIFNRYLMFLGSARNTEYLDLRVSYLIVAFEAIFSLDHAELAHQVSERAAFILESELKTKRVVYDDLKRAYNLRSKILHGSHLRSRDKVELREIAGLLDDYSRDLLTKFLDDEGQNWTSDDTDTRREYFKNLIFG